MNRRQLADNIDMLDEQIAELQREKAEFYAAYRDEFERAHDKEETRLELAAVKAAIRQRQKLTKDKDAVIEKGERIDTILAEIIQPAPKNAPAATASPARGRSDESSRTRANDATRPRAAACEFASDSVIRSTTPKAESAPAAPAPPPAEPVAPPKPAPPAPTGDDLELPDFLDRRPRREGAPA